MRFRLPVHILALLITLPPIGYADPDDPSFCEIARGIAVKANAEAPGPIDRLTRFEGMSVICFARVVEFKKSTTVTLAEISQHQIDRQQQMWNQVHCAPGLFREAIENGWTVRNVLNTGDGKRLITEADCNRYL